MIWKTLIAASVVAVLIGGYFWISQGAHTLTKDRERVVTTVTDELFGTTHEVVEWKPTFIYGLFPDDTSVTAVYRGYSFVLGSSIVIIVLSIVMLRRQRATQ